MCVCVCVCTHTHACTPHRLLSSMLLVYFNPSLARARAVFLVLKALGVLVGQRSDVRLYICPAVLSPPVLITNAISLVEYRRAQ